MSFLTTNAAVAKLVYAQDLKSCDSNIMRVRFPPAAQLPRRLMAGHQPLELVIVVRIHARQQKNWMSLSKTADDKIY